MTSMKKTVETTDELLMSARKGSVEQIVVRKTLDRVPSFRLYPGQALLGEGEGAVIAFAPGADGLQLSSNNEVRNIRLEASTDKRAIFNDTSVDGLGRIQLAGITTIGQVQILARDKVR